MLARAHAAVGAICSKQRHGKRWKQTKSEAQRDLKELNQILCRLPSSVFAFRIDQSKGKLLGIDISRISWANNLFASTMARSVYDGIQLNQTFLAQFSCSNRTPDSRAFTCKLRAEMGRQNSRRRRRQQQCMLFFFSGHSRVMRKWIIKSALMFISFPCTKQHEERIFLLNKPWRNALPLIETT